MVYDYVIVARLKQGQHMSYLVYDERNIDSVRTEAQIIQDIQHGNSYSTNSWDKYHGWLYSGKVYILADVIANQNSLAARFENEIVSSIEDLPNFHDFKLSHPHLNSSDLIFSWPFDSLLP